MLKMHSGIADQDQWSPLGRIYGIEVLRGIACALVVMWHVGVFGGEGELDFDYGFELTDFINYDVLFLAVPLFLLISLFLFFVNIEKKGVWSYSKKRLKRLAKIYAFWLTMQTLIVQLVSAENNFFNRSERVDGLHQLARFLVYGGGPLPLVGGSVFYFLSYLIVLTLLSIVLIPILDTLYRFETPTLILGFCYILFIPWATLLYSNIPYNSIAFGFFPILAFFIYKDYQRLLRGQTTLRETRIKGAILMLGWLITGGVENYWKYFHTDTIGPYSRVSLIFGATSALYFSIAVRPRVQFANKRVYVRSLCKMLATYSLGIYAIHKYILLLFLQFDQRLWFSTRVILFLFVLSFSLILVFFLARIRRVRPFLI